MEGDLMVTETDDYLINRWIGCVARGLGGVMRVAGLVGGTGWQKSVKIVGKESEAILRMEAQGVEKRE